MTDLHDLLAAYEADAAVRAARIADLGKDKAAITEKEKACRDKQRQAMGMVTRIRGLLEAIDRCPLPVVAFSPALDYPDSHPVQPPAPVEPAAPAQEAAIAAPAPAADDLTERVYRILDGERSGKIASIEWQKLLLKAKASPARVKKAIEALEQACRIRGVKSAEPGCKSFIMSDAAERAA